MRLIISIFLIAVLQNIYGQDNKFDIIFIDTIDITNPVVMIADSTNSSSNFNDVYLLFPQEIIEQNDYRDSTLINYITNKHAYILYTSYQFKYLLKKPINNMSEITYDKFKLQVFKAGKDNLWKADREDFLSKKHNNFTEFYQINAQKFLFFNVKINYLNDCLTIGEDAFTEKFNFYVPILVPITW